MFKAVPGNHDYVISLNGELRKASGKESDLPIKENKVNILLYNRQELIDVSWLALIAHFEIYGKEYYKNIHFINLNHKVTKSHCGKIMKIVPQVVFDSNYRLIPNFPKYAIDKAGKIINIDSREIIKSSVYLDNQYPTAMIYDPERSIYRRVLTHRLVALAWVKNSDYVINSIVNHLDGNKNNYHYKNLEWCTFEENANHAVRIGLVGKNREFKVFDHETNTEEKFSSFSNVCKKIGLNSTTSYKDKIYSKKNKLVNRRYEIKLLDDNTPWLSKKDINVKTNKFYIKVTFLDKHEEEFNKITDLMKRLKIWNISYNIKEIIRVAKIKYPGIIIDVTDNFPTKSVEAINLSTLSVLEAKSISEMSRLTGINYSTIHTALANSVFYKCKDFCFRFKTSDPWPEVIKNHPNTRIKVRLTNTVTSEVLEFPSIDSVVIAIKTSYYLVKNALTENKKIGNWVVEEIV